MGFCDPAGVKHRKQVFGKRAIGFLDSGSKLWGLEVGVMVLSANVLVDFDSFDV